MITDSKYELVVNAIGMLCPMPIIKVSDVIKNLTNGQTLQLIATDPGVVNDLRDWCQANQHTYLGEVKNNRTFYLWVRKGICEDLE